MLLNPIDDEQGSDYFLNGADLGVSRSLTKDLSVDWNASCNYYSFTSIDNGDTAPSVTIDEDPSDRDRIDGSTGVGFTYQASQRLSYGASVGVDISHMINDDGSVEITNPDGTVTTVSDDSSQDATSVAYSGHLDYLPTDSTAVGLFTRQSIGTDVDGERVIVRVFTATLSQNLGDRIDFGASGMFSQFTDDDTLGSDSTDRFEGTISLRYILTPSIALVGGYNYVDQNAPEEQQSIFLFADDYTGNRLFIGINAGLVGIKS